MAAPTTMPDSMRILMCAGPIDRPAGGAEHQAHNLAKSLVRRGHAVAILTQRVPGQPSADVVAGITVHRRIRGLGPGAMYGISYLLSSGTALARAARGYDLVHAHQLYLDAISAVAVRPFTRVPVVAIVACGGYVGDLARLRGMRWSGLWLEALRRIDRLVAISGEIHGELVADGFDPTRIVRIPNGVDTTWFCPAQDPQEAKRALGWGARTTVLFAGRLDAQKDVESLLEAWHAVASQRPDAQLVVLGTGPLEEQLKGLTARLGLADTVHFAGYRIDPRPFYQASDVFVLPSRAEGMPIALLEAMACGRPCVATAVGAAPELIEDGVTGLLVPPRAPEEIARALHRLLEDADLARRLGAAARRRVESRYDIERVADLYVNLYRELLARRAVAATRPRMSP